VEWGQNATHARELAVSFTNLPPFFSLPHHHSDRSALHSSNSREKERQHYGFEKGSEHQGKATETIDQRFMKIRKMESVITSSFCSFAYIETGK